MFKNVIQNKNLRFYLEFSTLIVLILLPFIVFRDDLYVITTNSMEPTLNVGDLVIKGYKSPEDIKADEEKGDILILKGPEYFYKKGFDSIFWGNLKKTPIIHRAVDKKKIDGLWYFKTKGDNNLVADGGYRFVNKTNDYKYMIIEYNDSNVIYICETEILGVVIFRIPYVGYLSIVFPVILILIIFIITIYLILKIFKYEIKIVKKDLVSKKNSEINKIR